MITALALTASRARDDRPSTFLMGLLLALLPCCLSAADATKPTDRPNVLLILADDLGWSDLGCYGGEIATPNIDALAKDGLRFHQFYNSARCSPSRACILTGLQPHQAGFPNLSGRLIDGSATIAEVARSAGYRTSMVGKWHLNEKNPPTERGFDEFFGMLGGYITVLDWLGRSDPENVYRRALADQPYRA